MRQHDKLRARWNGEAWIVASHDRRGPRPTVLQIQKTPMLIAAEIARMIVDAGLTDVVMLGERMPGGDAKAYTYMSSHRMVWYAEMLRFRGLHGRFPHDGSRHGAPV